MELILLVAGKDGNPIVWNVCPLLELKLPLQYRHGVGGQTDTRFLDGLCRRDTREGFPGTAGQNNDSRSGSSVSKHLGQGSFLVSTNPCDGLEVKERDVWIHRVVSKVVFLHERVIQFNSLPLDVFHLDRIDLKGYDHGGFFHFSGRVSFFVVGISVAGLSQHVEILSHFLRLCLLDEAKFVHVRLNVLVYSCLRNGRISQQLSQDFRKLGFDVKLVVFQDQLGLAVLGRTVPDKLFDFLGQSILREAL
mmetsp:Transcript_7946/g.16529  ORF Transcript_7946/g.16529 Transcript_7946/m.16529 type:complete len:249 (-) Transcript_7946:406-1152(-)